ncbi:hypothetical protein K2173_017620 [Erythroxylum novogranatense]|uniref:HMA domain-containing protein n=1 Tax=Erythroxylum novogranatense TaxID=1862640 RepID=A0AAV8TMB1_9ROSI|nr:hypothetical protein K2173_017620 [Erythroxylum novogranatense]
MGDEKKKDDLKEVVVEFNVPMHCNACERTVAKTISKFKGVERFTTEMNKHKVVVTGRVNPQKLLKKLEKKTRKRIEIFVDKNEEEDACNEEESNNKGENVELWFAWPPFFKCCKENDVLMMFSDENPNACSVM